MKESIKADGTACTTCAAKTRCMDGFTCEPSRLGSANIIGKHKRFVMGRNQTSGTTMRPEDCPHKEHKVSTEVNPFVLLRKQLRK